MFGSVFQALSYTYLVVYHFGDWTQLAEEARARMEDESRRLENLKSERLMEMMHVN